MGTNLPSAWLHIESVPRLFGWSRNPFYSPLFARLLQSCKAPSDRRIISLWRSRSIVAQEERVATARTFLKNNRLLEIRQELAINTCAHVTYDVALGRLDRERRKGRDPGAAEF